MMKQRSDDLFDISDKSDGNRKSFNNPSEDSPAQSPSRKPKSASVPKSKSQFKRRKTLNDLVGS